MHICGAYFFDNIIGYFYKYFFFDGSFGFFIHLRNAIGIKPLKMQKLYHLAIIYYKTFAFFVEIPKLKFLRLTQQFFEVILNRCKGFVFLFPDPICNIFFAPAAQFAWRKQHFDFQMFFGHKSHCRCLCNTCFVKIWNINYVFCYFKQQIKFKFIDNFGFRIKPNHIITQTGNVQAV